MAQRQDQQGRAPQGQDSGKSGQSQQGQGGSQPRQQQQFDAQTGRSPSGGGAEGRFVDQIREHMEVIGSDGRHVGTVDHVQDNQIKLTKADSSQHKHHYLQLSQVAGIEGNKIRLTDRGDTTFGL